MPTIPFGMLGSNTLISDMMLGGSVSSTVDQEDYFPPMIETLIWIARIWQEDEIISAGGLPTTTPSWVNLTPDIAIQSITLQQDGSWLYIWNTTGATFYRVILNGRQIAVTPNLFYNYQPIRALPYPPALEIMSGVTLALSERFQPYTILQWYQEVCEYYLVQLYDGTNWNNVLTFLEEGDWIYTYVSPIFPDETTKQWRVVAVDGQGNQSPVESYTRYVVCPPADPTGNIKTTYGGGLFTVSAA